MNYEDVEWELAACAGTDPLVWFPERESGGKVHPLAERICRLCDIKEDCFRYALDNDETGYWGGYHFTEKAGSNDGAAGEIHTGGNGDDMPEVWSLAA